MRRMLNIMDKLSTLKKEIIHCLVLHPHGRCVLFCEKMLFIFLPSVLLCCFVGKFLASFFPRTHISL